MRLLEARLDQLLQHLVDSSQTVHVSGLLRLESLQFLHQFQNTLLPFQSSDLLTKNILFDYLETFHRYPGPG